MPKKGKSKKGSSNSKDDSSGSKVSWQPTSSSGSSRTRTKTKSSKKASILKRISALTKVLGDTPAAPELLDSCLFPLRKYHSAPSLLLHIPIEPEFQQDGEVKRTFGRFKTMEDVVLSGLAYPLLITEPIFQVNPNRSYFISEKVRRSWEALAELETQRFSFYDALFSIGCVIDSLEVPSRLDEVSHLVEGEVSADQPLDYGRVVFKSKTVYTGNFSHGHFSGPGRYVWLDGTIYQGDFVDGLMHGEGLLLLRNGCFIEGEFKNGERTGWGVYTTPTGLMYAGEWFKGLPQGQGKVWYKPNVDDKDYYDGHWLAGVMHGFGTRQYSNGDRYIGNFQHGLRKGQGTMIWLLERQVYKGDWVDGVPHGFGEEAWYLTRSATCPYPQRNVYKGDFVQGQRHGIGRMIYASGSIYDGKWQDGKKHGKGIFVNPSGEVLFGIFRQDAIAGGADVPLHVPTYSCKFRPLVTILQHRLHLSDPVTSRLDEEYLSETVTRYLTGIRSLYKRAGYLGEWWGNQGHYPFWMRKEQRERKSHIHRRTTDPILESIQSQVYETDDAHYEIPWAYGHKPHYGSPDHVNPVTRFGLWLLLNDCPGVLSDITLAELDSIFNMIPSISFQTRHHPFEPVELWQFLQCLVVVASLMYIEIPKRNYQYDANLEDDEEPFDPEEVRRSNAEEGETSDKSETEGEPSAQARLPKTESLKGSDPSNSGRRKASDKSRKGSSKSRKESDRSSKGSAKSIKSTESLKSKKQGRKKSKKSSKPSLRPASIVKKPSVLEGPAAAETQTDGIRYGVNKNQESAQTEEIPEESQGPRDFLLSEAFELFLSDFLLPCLERRPGKYLPHAPNPLPSLADLYAAFNVVAPYKDVISAREFLISVLPHAVSPSNPIYWTRSTALKPPSIDMTQFFRTSFQTSLDSSTSQDKIDLLDYDFLSEKLSHVDILNEEIKYDIFGIEIERKDSSRRNSSIKIFGKGNTVFGSSATLKRVQSAMGLTGESSVGDDTIKSDLELEGDDLLPLAEEDLTAVPFLWETAPTCEKVSKNEKVLDNVGLSDVLRILGQFYPKTCDATDVINLEFNLTFGDWLWLSIIVTKLSTDRDFCSWMKKESRVEHKPGTCARRQLTRGRPDVAASSLKTKPSPYKIDA